MASAGRWQVGPQQHSRRERLPCDLETGSPRPNNWQWDFHKALPCPAFSPLQCLCKRTSGSEQQWFKLGVYACGRRAYLQNSQWHPHSSHRCSGAAGKRYHIGAKRQSPKSINVRRKPCGAPSTTMQQDKQCQQSPSMEKSQNAQSQISPDPLRQNADVQDADRITKLRCKKGLSALEAMASKGIKQRHLFLLYQSVILSVTDYGLGLTTLSQSNLLRLDRVQKEAMRVILATTKNTSIEDMRYLLDLTSIVVRHKMEQVKAYLNTMQNPKNPLHDAVKEEKGVQTGKKQVMNGSSRTINPACMRSRRTQASKELGKTSIEFKPYYKTPLSENPGTPCREWPASKASAEVQVLVEANSKPHDIVIYTDGSVTRDRSGWSFTVMQGGRTVHEDSGAHSHDLKPDHGGRSSHTCNTVASLSVWRTDFTYHHCHRLIEPPAKDGVWNGLPDWHTAMHSLLLQRLLWIYCPWHAWVSENERTDRHHIWSASWQGRGAQRLEELSEHGHPRASQHWSPEGKRSGERK